jgi:arylsulfatase A-like enzyme
MGTVADRKGTRELGELGKGSLQTGQRDGLSIYDVAPTVLHAFGIPTPHDMVGRNRGISLKEEIPVKRDDAYTEEEEAELARRLEDLGYL